VNKERKREREKERKRDSVLPERVAASLVNLIMSQILRSSITDNPL